MFPANQIKARIFNQNGSNTFTTGQPLSGYVEIVSPGKVHLRKITLNIQGVTVQLATQGQRLVAGKKRLDFTTDTPVHFPGGGAEVLLPNHAKIDIFPNFSRSKGKTDQARRVFNATNGAYHRIACDFIVELAEGNYQVKETQLPWERQKVLPIIILATLLSAIFWLVNLPELILLLAVSLLFGLERDYTHNAYFATLKNRIYTTPDGDNYLEVIADRGITRFLKAQLTLTATSVNTNVLRNGRHEFYTATIDLNENYHRTGARYRIPLPFPDRALPGSFHHHRYPSVVWTLEYSYHRRLLPDFYFWIRLRVATEPDKKATNDH